MNKGSMIKCKINGEQRNLEAKPVWKSQNWYSYRTMDHFTVIQLPISPKDLATTKIKIKTSGLKIDLI